MLAQEPVSFHHKLITLNKMLHGLFLKTNLHSKINHNNKHVLNRENDNIITIYSMKIIVLYYS